MKKSSKYITILYKLCALPVRMYIPGESHFHCQRGCAFPARRILIPGEPSESHPHFQQSTSLLVPRKLLQRFSVVFLYSDWLKWNHLRSRTELGFLDIFSRHICSAVTETIRVTNYATSFGAKKCSENQVRSC